jgi:hypothetical protein
MAMDLTPNTLLTRPRAAQFLTERGYQTAPATLATKATRGGGPEYVRYGRRPLYRPEKLLEWAQARLSKPVCSSSEAEATEARRNLKTAKERTRSR